MQHDLTVQQVDPATLHQLPGNPHSADMEALEESIAVNGFFSPVLVQKTSNIVVAGNHRLLIALKNGWKTIPAIILDVDDEQAARIALADNKVGSMGRDDESDLLAMLQAIDSTDGRLRGTGYAPDDLDYLNKLLNEPLTFEEPETETVSFERKIRSGTDHFTIIPQPDGDGGCVEFTLSRPDFRQLTSNDLNALRKMLGMDPLSKAELRQYDIEGWR